MLLTLCSGLPLDPLPSNNKRNPSIAHAAKRVIKLNQVERRVNFLTFFSLKFKIKINY